MTPGAPLVAVSPAAERPRNETTHALLLAGFLVYTFVGLHPLADSTASARVDGSVADRLAVLSLFALSLVVLWFHREKARACLLASPGQIVLLGMAVVSVFWSDFPDLTLRRALLLFFLTTINLAIVSGVADWRRFHTFLFVVLTAVVVANLAAAALIPSLTVTEFGVNGLYAQKNVAGAVAMIAAIVGFGWLLGASRARELRNGLLALFPILVFLILTRSKTSINLTVLGVAAMAFFALAERLGARFILAALSLALIGAAGLLAALAAFDFDSAAIMNALFVDTTFTGRDQLWAFTLNEALKRYWWGHGYGAFWDVGYGNDPILRVETGSWLASTEVGVINQAHNGYIELWLELGLPAAIVGGLTILRGAAVGAGRAILGAGARQDRAAFAALAALLALHLLHNLTEATLFVRGQAFASIASLALFAMSAPIAMAEGKLR